MNDNRYILVIADDSPEMEIALEYACARSKKTSRKIIVATFIEPLDVLTTQGVTEIMKNEIEKKNFLDSKNILISNVTAKEILNKEELKKLLIDQIENRVRWRESVINMISKGVGHFIEIGPGKVLSGLIKRIDKNVKINTMNNESDIKDLKL